MAVQSRVVIKIIYRPEGSYEISEWALYKYHHLARIRRSLRVNRIKQIGLLLR